MRKLLFFVLLGTMIYPANSQTSEIIISEYIEGWSNNKALELYNPTANPVDLGEFRLIRYSNGEDVPPAQDNWTVGLPNHTLQPYQTFVIVIDQRNPDGTGQDAPVWEQLQQRADAFLCPEYEVSETMYFNGDDAIVIEKNEGGNEYIIHDIFGRWGPPAPAIAVFVGSDKEDNAWTNVAPYVTGEGVAITAEHTMIRKSNVATGVTVNPSLFNPLAEYDTLPANTFDRLGWHTFDNAPENETPVLTNEKLTYAVSPSATNGTTIETLVATDAEGDALKYYIDYGNFIYIDNQRIEPFSLDEDSGILSLIDERGLAPEVLDTFYLAINITDGYSQLGPVNIRVIVTDDEVGVESHLNSSLKVYPNPVTGNTINIVSQTGIKALTLTNITGQVIGQQRFDTSILETNIDIQEEPNGIYILMVRFEDKSFYTRKILIE